MTTIGTGYDPRLTHRWPFCYLDGKLHEMMGDDIFMADAPMPENGQHEVVYQTDTGLEVRCIASIYRNDGQNGLVHMIGEFHI